MSTGTEIRAKEKFKREKQLMDYQHGLDIKLNKKALILSKISIFIAVLTLLFTVSTYYGWILRFKSIVTIDKQQTTINDSHSNAHD